MHLKLFHGWFSSASRRVRLCLAEKNIDYESVPIDISRQENHTPEYLKLNPNGVIPALLIDGKPMHESSTICEFIEDVFPSPRLRPEDPYQRAVMRNFVRHTDERCLPNLLILNWSLTLQPGASQWTDQELKERLDRIPTAERKAAWLRIARNPYTEEEKQTALDKLLALIDKMDGMLEQSPWLLGPDFTLADIAAIPFIARIAELAPGAIPTSARVSGWWQRVQVRPGFINARIDRFETVMAERQKGAVH